MRNAILATTLLLAACTSSTEKGPQLPSSSTRPVYAVRYNDELAASVKSLGDAQEREKTISAGLDAHVDDLKKPDWDKVKTIIDDSDEAGRSSDFAGAEGDVRAVKAFWDGDKDVITSRVAGNAQHTVTQAGCTAEVSGAVSFAMNDAINKQLQKKLRSRNEAFLLIERYKSSLGPQNAATLEKLADDLAAASYDVHVAMPVERSNLRRMVAEKDDVKQTLDRFIQEETAYQNEPGRTDAEKKASNDRLSAANKAKSEIDVAAAEAEKVAKQADAAIDAATKDYESALEKLRAKVAEKQKAETEADKGKATAAARARAPRGS